MTLLSKYGESGSQRSARGRRRPGAPGDYHKSFRNLHNLRENNFAMTVPGLSRMPLVDALEEGAQNLSLIFTYLRLFFHLFAAIYTYLRITGKKFVA